MESKRQPYYDVYDYIKGRYVYRGSRSDCCKLLGFSSSKFYAIANHRENYDGRYAIDKVEDAYESEDLKKPDCGESICVFCDEGKCYILDDTDFGGKKCPFKKTFRNL